MKKLLVLGIVTAMLFTSNYSVNAAGLVDSVGATEENPYGGIDTTQNKQTTYDDESVTDLEYTASPQIEVYVTKASKITYKIPQVIVGSSDGKAVYKIGIKGDISSTQKITITPPASFILTDGSKNITARISQNKSSWVSGDLTSGNLEDGYSMTTGTITYTVPAGSFRGTFNFNVTITNSN